MTRKDPNCNRYQYPLDWMQKPYPERLAIVQEALAKLQQQVAEQCGPEHEYIDHHDGQAPYCPRCRVTDSGLPLSDYRSRDGRPGPRSRELDGRWVPSNEKAVGNA